MINNEIKNKIIAITKLDQNLRKDIFRNGHKPTKDEMSQLKKIDIDSTNFMKEIINEYGLPTIQKVGKLASFNAWLLVQHSSDIKFQKHYLKLLKNAKKNEVKAEHAAYLEDRILMKEGRPQIYGTQVIFDKKTREAKPYKLVDKNNIDQMRFSVGLETLDEYLKSFL